MESDIELHRRPGCPLAPENLTRYNRYPAEAVEREHEPLFF